MIEQAEAEQLFAAHVPTLHRVVHAAWRKVSRSDIRFSPRGRANAMWDEMTHGALNEWADDDVVRIVPASRGQTAAYWIRDDVMFRLKKANRGGFTRNYPTAAALMFHEPVAPIGTQFELFAPATRFEVAYVLNRDATEIEEIMVVHRTRDTIDYRFKLVFDGDVTTLPTSLPGSDEAAAPARDTVVRLKGKKTQQRNAEDDGR